MRRTILIGICLVLAACGDTPVVLRNPASGVVVKCSPSRSDEGQAHCIENFRSQGFEPVT